MHHMLIRIAALNSVNTPQQVHAASVVNMALNLQVKHGANTLDVQMDPAATVAQMQDMLQQLTGVFARKQKLIFKGKVLDAGKTLAAQGVTNGAKVMLLSAQDGTSSTGTKGQQAMNTLSQQKAQEAKARLEASFAAIKAGNPIPSAAANLPAKRPQPQGSLPELEQRQRNWRATGVLALRDLGLTSLPHDLLSPPPAGPTPCQPWPEVLRNVDICHNQLTALPPALFTLTSLVSLKASSNQLTDAGVPWEGLSQLTALTRLALDHNQLICLPGPPLPALQRLRHLSITHNQLAALPPELGQLPALQLLEADMNQVQGIPPEIGGCTSLLELSLCSNAITQLPESLTACTALQCVKLDSNRVQQVPGSILQGCTHLWLLSLNNNPITIDQLRETPGYAALDERRRARADKQIEGRVLLDSSSAFSEGADAQEWSHWGQPLKKLGGSSKPS